MLHNHARTEHRTPLLLRGIPLLRGTTLCHLVAINNIPVLFYFLYTTTVLGCFFTKKRCRTIPIQLYTVTISFAQPCACTNVYRTKLKITLKHSDIARCILSHYTDMPNTDTCQTLYLNVLTIFAADRMDAQNV